MEPVKVKVGFGLLIQRGGRSCWEGQCLAARSSWKAVVLRRSCCLVCSTPCRSYNTLGCVSVRTPCSSSATSLRADYHCCVKMLPVCYCSASLTWLLLVLQLAAGSSWEEQLHRLETVADDTGEQSEDHYLNLFAIGVDGGRQQAEVVASDYGCHIHDQLFQDEGSGDGAVYLVQCHEISKRSAEPSHSHLHNLRNTKNVRWVEQQYNKKRFKREGGGGANDNVAGGFISSSAPANSGHSFFTDVFGDFVRSFSFERPSHGSFFSGGREASQYGRTSHSNQFWPDPLFREQWYLNGGAKDGGDMRVLNVWRRGYTGKGVVVSILDDGIQPNHPDLIENYDPAASLDINDNDDDPTPRDDGTNRHGTRCAGEVAATAGNTVCGVGVAPNASIGGVRMLDGGVNDYVEAKALSFHRDHIDIYSASWGPEDDGKTVDGPGPLARRAFIEGVLKGRHGKGSIFVWASGNGGQYVDNCNCDGYTNSIFTLSISSASQAGHKPWYLEECASTLATTYSSGTPLQDKSVATCDQDAALRDKHICTVSHTGTSASAPLAAGLCALALEANPALTWRDMQYIVLMTSRPEPLAKEFGWITNAVGRKVSHKFGYGMMDGEAMVELAEKWTPVPPQHICISPIDSNTRLIPKQVGGQLHVSMDVDACSSTSQTVNYLEHVQCKVTLTYVPRGNLRILLTSPRGTVSTLLFERPRDVTGSSFDRWPFMSVHFWGEPARGRWNLTIINTRTRSPRMEGVLKEWQLIVYGTEFEPVRLRRSSTPESSHSDQSHSTAQTAAESVQHPSIIAVSRSGKATGSDSGGAALSPVDGEFESSAGSMLTGRDNSAQIVSDSGYCSPLCVESCTSDISADRVRCARCRAQFKSNCLSSCNAGFYLSSSPVDHVIGGVGVDQCLPCAPDCLQCHGPLSNQCLQCADTNSFLVPLTGTCVHRCPNAFFPANSTCHSCGQHCASCSTTGECLVCNDNLLLSSGRCVSSCPVGTFRQQHRCLRCAVSCASCVGPDAGQCLLCADGLVFSSNGHCLSATPCSTAGLCASLQQSPDHHTP